MFLPSHKGVQFPPYTWALWEWANPVGLRVPACRPPSLLPVHSVCKPFSTVAAVPLRAGGLAYPSQCGTPLSIIVPSRISIPRLAKTCRFLQASMD
jgi:hypothetical protein